MKWLVLAGLLVAAPVMAEMKHSGWGGNDGNARKGQVRQQYNPFENRWETTRGEKRLQYDPFNNKWSYEGVGERPYYNPHEDKWEYAK